MFRLLLAISSCVIAVFASSCGCCTSDAVAPPLRPLPQFQEIETEIEYTK